MNKGDAIFQSGAATCLGRSRASLPRRPGHKLGLGIAPGDGDQIAGGAAADFDQALARLQGPDPGSAVAAKKIIFPCEIIDIALAAGRPGPSARNVRRFSRGDGAYRHEIRHRWRSGPGHAAPGSATHDKARAPAGGGKFFAAGGIGAGGAEDHPGVARIGGAVDLGPQRGELALPIQSWASSST